MGVEVGAGSLFCWKRQIVETTVFTVLTELANYTEHGETQGN